MGQNQEISEPHDQTERDTDRDPKTSSKLLKWYKSITPRTKPEDFSKQREEFEEAVAEEVASES